MENITNDVDHKDINTLKDLGLNDELESALKETVMIEDEYKKGKRKGCKNANEMLRSILDD